MPTCYVCYSGAPCMLKRSDYKLPYKAIGGETLTLNLDTSSTEIAFCRGCGTMDGLYVIPIYCHCPHWVLEAFNLIFMAS